MNYFIISNCSFLSLNWFCYRWHRTRRNSAWSFCSHWRSSLYTWLWAMWLELIWNQNCSQPQFRMFRILSNCWSLLLVRHSPSGVSFTSYSLCGCSTAWFHFSETAAVQKFYQASFTRVSYSAHVLLPDGYSHGLVWRLSHLSSSSSSTRSSSS